MILQIFILIKKFFFYFHQIFFFLKKMDICEVIPPIRNKSKMVLSWLKIGMLICLTVQFEFSSIQL
jgi:hypothetical protein